jgi:hypothetical protein
VQDYLKAESKTFHFDEVRKLMNSSIHALKTFKYGAVILSKLVTVLPLPFYLPHIMFSYSFICHLNTGMKSTARRDGILNNTVG